MDEIISVVVPVYNVAPYLEQCARSILSQDYSALEVILIDDGSTDGSAGICDEIAAADSRVRVIHQKNAGAAAAKNAGLRVAAGTYLSFVDSDDFLEPGAYRFMVDVLKRTGADAVQCGFRDVYVSSTQMHIPKKEMLDGKTYLTRFPKDWSCALLWNKLYRRQLYDGVFFEEGHKIDDEYFTYQGFLGKCTVAVEGRIVYNYRKRASSVMSSAKTGEQRIEDTLDAVEKRRERVLSVYPEMKKLLDENYLDVLWNLSENPFTTQKTLELIRRRLGEYFRSLKNSPPPRWLWGRLWRTYFTSPQKQLAELREKAPQLDEANLFP